MKLSGTGVAATDPRLVGALLGLLSHDLRAPLGPLALAASSIADDPSASADLREIARFAEAQTVRIGRLIESTLAACGKQRGFGSHAFDLAEAAGEAAATLGAIGIVCAVEAEAADVVADRAAVRDAIACLAEVVAGDACRASIAVRRRSGSVEVVLSGPDVAGCARALGAIWPADWREAFALGARAVIRAHGGDVESADGRIVAWIPGRAA